MSAEVEDVTSIEMSVQDEDRLVDLETIIEAGLDAFIAVGAAITEIRDAKLYRATHGTFEAYLADRWEISRSRGYQLIAAARVSTVVDNAGLPTPTNEAQARELARVPQHQVVPVWEAAVKMAGPANPTATTVQDAAKKVTPSPEPSAPPRARPRKPLPDAFRSREREATKAVTAMVKLAQDNRWDQNLDLLRGTCRSDIERLILALQQVRSALDGTVVADPDYEVVIVKGPNTASVTVPKFLRHKIFSTLRGIGAKSQSKSDGSIEFPARYAERLQANLLTTNTVAEVVSK